MTDLSMSVTSVSTSHPIGATFMPTRKLFMGLRFTSVRFVSLAHGQHGASESIRLRDTRLNQPTDILDVIKKSFV